MDFMKNDVLLFLDGNRVKIKIAMTSKKSLAMPRLLYFRTFVTVSLKSGIVSFSSTVLIVFQ